MPIARVFLACSCFVLLVATSSATEAPSPPPDHQAVKPPSQPFIIEARVFHPKKVGDWRFKSAKIYPDVSNGLNLRYVAKKHPELTVDVFVYPAGLMPMEQAIQDGGDAFQASFVLAELEGHYLVKRDVERRDLRIDREPLAPLLGVRFDLALSSDRGTIESTGVLLYRYLHYVKLRISGPEREPGYVSRTTDELTEKLARAIRIVNRGGCHGGNEITVMQTDELPEHNSRVNLAGNVILVDGNEDDDTMGQLLLQSVGRRMDMGCVESFKSDLARKKRGERFETLVYPDDVWTASD